ncbi:MAG: hypothetical protein FWH53_08520, partial [Leptospirales bacterium]|nr:hypothetical protein [Leptospirales bacterium]
RYEKNSSFFGKTLQQLYYENILNTFDEEPLFERDRIYSMVASLEMMRKTLIRVEGIIWLKLNESDHNKAKNISMIETDSYEQFNHLY